MYDRIIPTTDMEDCHSVIKKRGEKIKNSVDEDDDEVKSSVSVRKYKQHLRWFDAWLKNRELEPSDVGRVEADDIGVHLSATLSSSTALYRWYEVRKLYSELARKRLVPENPFDLYTPEELKEEFGFSRTSEQDKNLEDGERYAVSQEEIRMMEQERPKPRDQLVIRMLWQTGLRRGELSHLTVDDLDRDAREVTVESDHAKSGVSRVVPYQSSLGGLLAEWLDYGNRAACLAGDEDQDWVFVGERGGRLSGRRISEIVRDAAAAAGLQRELSKDSRGGSRRKITAHNVRHGYGTYMVSETDASIYQVSKLLGHSSVEVTEDVYVEDDPRDGVEAGRKYGPE